jgi:hypothetical protein
LTIRKGFSDMRKSEPFYFPITREYIKYCKRKNVPAVMFVNSDAHKGSDVGGYELETLKKNINGELLKRIKVPYNKF